MGARVLILSWEYPPIVAGGLARHVRKLAENLVASSDAEVHVLTRGSRHTPVEEVMNGVHVHRVTETTTPADLDELRRLVPDARTELLDDCGHFAHVEHPAAVAALLAP